MATSGKRVNDEATADQRDNEIDSQVTANSDAATPWASEPYECQDKDSNASELAVCKISDPLMPLPSEATSTNREMMTWTPPEDSDVLSGNDCIDIKSTDDLEKVILDQRYTAKVYPLLLIVTGFPKAGMTTAIKNMFPSLTDSQAPQNSSFTNHEFISTGLNTSGKKIRTGLTNFSCQSLRYAIQSGLIKMHDRDLIKVDLPEKCQRLNGNSKLKNSHLRNHVSAIATHIQERQGSLNEHWLTDPNISTRQKKIETTINRHGIAIGNLWDMSINDTIRPFIESICPSFNCSRMWVFIDLNDDYRQLYLPLDDKTDDKNLRMQWKPRIQYLMRICQICKYTPKQHDDGYKKFCTIFAADKNKMPSLKQTRELKSELENAAVQMGVHDVINFDIKRVHVRKENMKTHPLRNTLNSILYHLGNKNAVDVPLPWLFFRSAFVDFKKFYIKRCELQSLAEECQIDDLDEFCKFFSSFGSIFDIKSCDYVIIKPVEFLTCLQNLLNQSEGCCVNRMKQVSNVDEDVLMQVLVSTQAFALTTKDLYLKNSLSTSSFQTYYLPDIAQKSLSKIKGSSAGALQLIMSMKSPRHDMHVIMTKQLLATLNLPDHSLTAKFSADSVNSVNITVEGYPSLNSTEGEAEKCKISTEFMLIFQGNITEIVFKNDISQLSTEQKNAYKSLCMMITEALHKMLYTMSSEYTSLNGLRYCFAVQCAGDSLSKEAAFNIYRKRHILPNFKLCEDCELEYKANSAILKMWNVAVEKVLIKEKNDPHSKQLMYEKDEDLTVDDAKVLATEIAKYPLKWIRKFAKAIRVKVYIHDEQEEPDERAKAWYVMGMMMELEEKKSEFLSKKAMAAVLIKLYDELKEGKLKEKEDKDEQEETELDGYSETFARQQFKKGKKGDEDENELDESELAFERLARQLHIEVLSHHQKRRILHEYDQRNQKKHES